MRTEPAAHWPPTKPSMVPSASTIARSPACAELGSWARTTVAWTNGTRERVSSSIALGELGRHASPPQIGGVGWPCMASHTRDGVSGMSACRMP